MIETVSLPAVRRRSGQGLPRNRHTLALIPEPSIWALSAPATLRTRQARAATCVSTRAGPGRAPGAQACLRAHLCGVGSHGEAWQEPRCQEPRTRCPEQWEPALIGKTRQDRAWHRSQRRTNFHSPSPLFFLDRLLLECVQVWHVHKITVTVLYVEESIAFLYKGTFC